MSDPVHVLPHHATLDGYDRWSSHYDRDDNPMVAATAWALEQRPLEVRGAAVLELGCGTGRHALGILEAGAARYLGVDGSPQMLAIAQRRTADPRCTWRLVDLAAPTSLGDRDFDAALVVLVIEHLHELAPALEAIAAALRSGGRLRMVEIHPDLVAAGTIAHFRSEGGEVRFASVAHPIADIRDAIARAGLVVDESVEYAADDALLAAVPRLAKHRGRRVLVDINAHR